MTDHTRLEELRRRVQADPTSIAFAALAEEYRRAGQYEEAIEVCRTGLTRHPAYISARVTLGRTLLELDRLDEAEAELSAVLKIAPENLAAIRAQAEIHARRGVRAPSRAAGAAAAPAAPEAEAHAPFELDLIGAVPEPAPPPDPAASPLEAPAQDASPAGPVTASPPLPSTAVIMEAPAAAPVDRADAGAQEALPALERLLDRILTRRARGATTRS